MKHMNRMFRLSVFLLTICLMVACTPAQEKPVQTTDSADNTVTEPATDSTAESATDPRTDSVTDPETEKETSPVPTEEEIRSYLYEHTEEQPLEIVAWGSPMNRELYETFFGILQNAGVNTYLVNDEYYGDVGRLIDITEAAESVGMNIYINTYGDQSRAIVEKLKWLCDSPVLKGLYLRDEPLPGMYEKLGETKQYLNEQLPQTRNLMIGSTLLPAAAMGGGQSNYRYTVQYMEAAQPDYLCWDFYPFSSQTSKNSRYSQYLLNLLQVKTIAMAYDVPVYSFIQTSRINRQEGPSVEQLRLLFHSSLALGSKSLFLFTVGQIGDDVPYVPGKGETFNYLISYDCSELTDSYYRLSDVIHGIEPMKGVYLGYEFEGAVFQNLPDVWQKFDEYGVGDICYSGYRELEDVIVSKASAGAIVGCFTKEEESAFYVVNPDYTVGGAATDITLCFSEAATYQIWGSGGLETIGSCEGTLTLTVLPGDGKFVILNTDNTIPKE